MWKGLPTLKCNSSLKNLILSNKIYWGNHAMFEVLMRGDFLVGWFVKQTAREVSAIGEYPGEGLF